MGFAKYIIGFALLASSRAFASDPIEAILSAETRAIIDALLRPTPEQRAQADPTVLQTIDTDPARAAELLATRAEAAFDGGDANLALGLFHEATLHGPITPYRAWAGLRVGELLADAEHPELAERAWVALLDADPLPNPATRVHDDAGCLYLNYFHTAALRLATAAENRGDVQGAIDWLTQADTTYPFATWCGNCMSSNDQWLQKKRIELEQRLPDGSPRPFTAEGPRRDLCSLDDAVAAPATGTRTRTTRAEPDEMARLTEVVLILFGGAALAIVLRRRDERAL